MVTVKDLYEYMENKIPSSLSLDWDKDGLQLCPDAKKEVKKIICTLDVTPAVCNYAIENKTDVIISHHSLIFKPLSEITSPKLIGLIKNDISVMSFHTRMDIVENGINCKLAKICGLEKVYNFAENCGRIGYLKTKTKFENYIEYIKDKLNCEILESVNSNGYSYKIAVISGSSGDYIEEALKNGTDTLVTGEIKYHTMLECGEMGLNVIAAGHYHTEKHAAELFCDIIKKEYSEIKIETIFM